MTIMEAERVGNTPLLARAESLGIDPANLAGLPEEVAEACLDLVTYATRSAVNSYLANPTAVLSKVEENLRELMATASLTDTDERNQIIADINRAIACETADPQKITNLERKVGRKLDNWLTVAQGSFTNYLTGAQSASRTGRVLSQEEVTAQFAVLGIQPEVVAKKLGVAIGDPEPAFVTPQPEPEQTAQPAPKPVTLSTKATHDAAKPKFTINTVKSSQRVGGLAAAGAIVFTLATPTTAQATETTPSTPPAPQQSASAPAEVAPQTEPVAVQEIGADGGAVDITPAVSADTPAPGAEVIATIPNLKETTQPAEVVNEPAVTVSTTVNPITGEVTNVAKPAASAEANTPRENNQAATELLAKLTPAFRDGITRLNKAADHKSLNYLSQSDADVYGTKDPKTHKTIPIKLDEEYAATLQAQYDVLVAIIANDKTFIDSVTKMFDEMPLDKDKQAIIDTVEKIKFTEDGADDFEPAQKTALLTYIAYINTQTQSYAQNVVNARMSEYQKEQDAKAKAKAEQTTKSPEAKASNKYSLLIPKIRDEAQLAAAINAYIREVAPDSPFVGQGKNFVKGAKKHGVNPLIPVVIAQMDSNFSTKGIAARYHTNNPWNRDCPDGKPRVHYTDGRSGHSHSACTYDSPEQALLQDDYEGMEAARKGHDSIYAYLERKYLSHNITSLEAFLAIYTPSAESSKAEHEHLLAGYKHELNKLYDMAGDSISFGVRLSKLKDLPKDPGSRYTTREIAAQAAPGESMFGPDDPCSKLMGNVRIVCAAQKFLGIRYGTADPGYAPKWEDVWNQKIESWGGHNPKGWIFRNKKGSTNDFLECSGFVAVAIAAAYNVDVDNCSAGFLSDTKNFKQINPRKVRAGDLVIASKRCGGKQGGHVGIVISYDPKTKELVTLEASAGMSSEGYARTGVIKRHKIGVDFHYAARYIGAGSDAALSPA